MDSQERFENMVGLVEAHQYEWAIWQAAERQEPDTSVVKRIATQMGWTPPGEQESVAWYIPDENGKPFKTTGYSFEAAQLKAAGATVLPLYAAPTPERAQESAGVQLSASQLGELYHTARNADSFRSFQKVADEILTSNKEPQ